ncbi:hypothetical protein HYC85_005817 [Camellia sinensis]|uniref:Glutaredoxin domain-containing protein n=1 Tax=Camellia sinensis TaxID=4442 RepID=A0A7J7I0K2_CAMSI|nr:hypothetical protein HYC85_005817 [Camellia sinensis]
MAACALALQSVLPASASASSSSLLIVTAKIAAKTPSPSLLQYPYTTTTTTRAFTVVSFYNARRISHKIPFRCRSALYLHQVFKLGGLGWVGLGWVGLRRDALSNLNPKCRGACPTPTPTATDSFNWLAQALTPELKTTLDKVVTSQKVVLFMKGTKEFPQCGFSHTVVQILKSLNVPFETINILENDMLRQGLKEYSNWPTFPQLYIDGEFFGGCDITVEAYKSGELQELLEKILSS